MRIIGGFRAVGGADEDGKGAEGGGAEDAEDNGADDGGRDGDGIGSFSFFGLPMKLGRRRFDQNVLLFFAA